MKNSMAGSNPNPAMTNCVCQRNWNVLGVSRCGILPTTSSSHSRRTRNRRSRRNGNRSLCRTGSLRIYNLRTGTRGHIARRAEACRRFPYRRRRTFPS